MWLGPGVPAEDDESVECGMPLGVPVVADPVTASALRVVSVSVHPVRGLRVTVQASTCS